MKVLNLLWRTIKICIARLVLHGGTNELVRCKNCKFFRPNNPTVGCLKVLRSENADGDWFCAAGEKRTDE